MFQQGVGCKLEVDNLLQSFTGPSEQGPDQQQEVSPPIAYYCSVSKRCPISLRKLSISGERLTSVAGSSALVSSASS